MCQKISNEGVKTVTITVTHILKKVRDKEDIKKDPNKNYGNANHNI